MSNLLSNTLAERLEQGAKALAALAGTLTDAEWNTKFPKDGRSVGVVIHHVASVYPVEIQLAQTLASGKPLTGVYWETVHQMNAGHAKENAGATRKATVELLEQNSKAAAAAIRALSDDELRAGGTNSMYSDAPLTCQFMLEDHAVRHSYHHLALIRALLKK